MLSPNEQMNEESGEEEVEVTAKVSFGSWAKTSLPSADGLPGDVAPFKLTGSHRFIILQAIVQHGANTTFRGTDLATSHGGWLIARRVLGMDPTELFRSPTGKLFLVGVPEEVNLQSIKKDIARVKDGVGYRLLHVSVPKLRVVYGVIPNILQYGCDVEMLTERIAAVPGVESVEINRHLVSNAVMFPSACINAHNRLGKEMVGRRVSTTPCWSKTSVLRCR